MSRFTEYNSKEMFENACSVMQKTLQFTQDTLGKEECIRYAYATYNVYSESLNVIKHHLQLRQYRYRTIASMIVCEEFLKKEGIMVDTKAKETPKHNQPTKETEAGHQLKFQNKPEKEKPTKDKYFEGIFTNE